MPVRNVPLPVKGYAAGTAFCSTNPEYSLDMYNVRVRDVLGTRIRLGQRPGMAKWSSTQLGSATQPIVAMCIVATQEALP
jgi:hypothetical protein